MHFKCVNKVLICYFCCKYSHRSLVTHFKMYIATQILCIICYFCCKYSPQNRVTHFKMYTVTQIVYWLIVHSNQHIFFLLTNISFSRTLNALVLYGYVTILSNVCIFLSSLLLINFFRIHHHHKYRLEMRMLLLWALQVLL